jgi:hypothetical protein
VDISFWVSWLAEIGQVRLHSLVPRRPNIRQQWNQENLKNIQSQTDLQTNLIARSVYRRSIVWAKEHLLQSTHFSYHPVSTIFQHSFDKTKDGEISKLTSNDSLFLKSLLISEWLSVDWYWWSRHRWYLVLVKSTDSSTCEVCLWIWYRCSLQSKPQIPKIYEMRIALSSSDQIERYVNRILFSVIALRFWDGKPESWRTRSRNLGCHRLEWGLIAQNGDYSKPQSQHYTVRCGKWVGYWNFLDGVSLFSIDEIRA